MQKQNGSQTRPAADRGVRPLGSPEERDIYRREMIASVRYWLRTWRDVFANKTPLQEVIAGITVAAVALPLNLALASASGLPASAGLVAGAIGGMIAGTFGGAPLCITGPAAALQVMVLAIVKDFGPAGAAGAALLVGGIQILLALTMAGKLARHVPESVLAGFTTGVGIKLLDGQIPELLGFDYKVYELAQMTSRPEWLHEVSWLATVSGLGVAFLIVTTKQWTRFPAALVGVAIVTALSRYVGFDIERVGEVPNSLPPFALPALPDSRWVELFQRALPLGLLAAVESLLCAKAVERMRPNDPPHDSNVELFGQGLANTTVGLLSGMTVSAVFVRTGVNVQSGARTRISSIIHGATLLTAMLFLSKQLSTIPLAALAGLLVVVAFRLIEVTTLVHLFRTEKAGALAFLAAAIGTVTGHLVTGLALGLAIHFIAHFATRRTREEAEKRDQAKKAGVRAILTREQAPLRKLAAWEPPPSAHEWLGHIQSQARVPRSAYVHPKAALIGDVTLGENVHIAAGSSVRADEGTPFYIGDDTNVQDGVVLHALKKKTVRVGGEPWAIFVGKNVSIAHDALVHGPSYVGDHTFIGFKAVVHDSVVGKHCFIGIGAIVVGVEVPDERFVPHGALIDSADAVAKLKHVSDAQREFNEDVVGVNRGLAAAYNVSERLKELALCDGACCGAGESDGNGRGNGSSRKPPVPPTGPARLPRAPVWSPSFTRFRGVRF